MLLTSHETMLDALIERPLVDGDLLAAANTLIYMGKIRDGEQAVAWAVHRQASRQRVLGRDRPLHDRRRRNSAGLATGRRR